MGILFSMSSSWINLRSLVPVCRVQQHQPRVSNPELRCSLVMVGRSAPQAKERGDKTILLRVQV